MKQQGLNFSNETIAQASELAKLWGLPQKRHFSAVVSRTIERTYTAVFTGVSIEEFSKISADELSTLLITLIQRLNEVKANKVLAEVVETFDNREILESLTTEITRLESLIEKIKRAK